MNQTYGNTGSQDPPRKPTGGASASGEQLKGKARSVGEDLKAQAQDAGQQARAKAETGFDRQAEKAADKVESVAEGVRAAADRLEDDDNAQMSEYLARAASTIDGLADSMRNKSADELMRDVRQLAVKNPGLFLAGSVAVGFGLTRFARASARGSAGSNGGMRSTSGSPIDDGDGSGASGSASAAGGPTGSSTGAATSGVGLGSSGSSAAAPATGTGARLPRSGNPAATPPATPSPGVGSVRNNPPGKGGNKS